MPSQSMTGVHLKLPKCLQCKVGTKLGEKRDGFGREQRWFVGLGLGKHWDVARVGSIHVLLISNTQKFMRAQFFSLVERWCWC